MSSAAPAGRTLPALVSLTAHVRALLTVAGEALSEGSVELFAALLAKPQDELVRLLTVCEVSTVDAVNPAQHSASPVRNWRKPWGWIWPHGGMSTAEGYFKHVPKAAILNSVGPFAPSHVTRLAKLKKADIASEAERLTNGTGWMPAMFKAEGAQPHALVV